jgi:MOSC domain-containing protein YiiM
MSNGSARVVSVNVGRPREVQSGTLAVSTAIWKMPVSGRVALTQRNFEGDQQADLSVHGGPDKAVYAYAIEDLDWWADNLNRPLGPGSVGENLTTKGIDLSDARIGERWAVGSAVLQVTQPRIPCYKLGIRFGDPKMPARFGASLRSGLYLRVLTPGEIGGCDPIEVSFRPDHDATIGLVVEAYHRDHGLADRLTAVADLPEGWRDWAAKTAAAVRKPRPHEPEPSG